MTVFPRLTSFRCQHHPRINATLMNTPLLLFLSNFIFLLLLLIFSSYPRSTLSPGFSSTRTFQSPSYGSFKGRHHDRKKKRHFVLCDATFSRMWLWTLLTFCMWRRVVWYIATDVSHAPSTSMFRLQKWTRNNPEADNENLSRCVCVIVTITEYVQQQAVSFRFSHDVPQLPQGRRCHEWLPLRAPGQTGSAAWQRCESQDSSYTRTL